MLQEFLENCYTSGLKPWIVDVRDVARAHVRAAEVALRFHSPLLLGVVLQPACMALVTAAHVPDCLGIKLCPESSGYVKLQVM